MKCALVLLAFIIGWVLLTVTATPEELPRGLGHTGDHWFPENCCHKQHCEPIPDNAWKEIAPGRYEVRYISYRNFEVWGVIGATGPSQDKTGLAVSCAYHPPHPNGFGEGSPAIGKPHCFFLPTTT